MGADWRGRVILLPELLLTLEASAGLEHGWGSKWTKRIQEGVCERRKSKELALGARGPQFGSGPPYQLASCCAVLNSPGALASDLPGLGRGPGVQRQVLLRATIIEASALSPGNRQARGPLRTLQTYSAARER